MSRPLRVGGVPEHFNLPWRLAARAGSFERAGCPVEWREYPAGTGELTRALRDAELDVAVVLTEGAVLDVLAHDRNRLLKVWVASPLVWGIHVAARSELYDPGEMRGLPVAISRHGSGSHLIPIVDAAERGWDTAAMRFVVVNDLAGARAALADGRAELFFWERHMTQPLVDAGEFRRIGERIVPWPAFVVSARRETIAAHPHELRRVLDIAATHARNLGRRVTAVPLIAETFGIREADIGRWLGGVRWATGWRCPAAALRRVVAALESQGVVERGPVHLGQLWARLST